jgi:hypothetical protein
MAAIGLIVFIVSFQFLPSAGAIRMAIATPIAGAVGFAAGGISLSPFFPKTLTSTGQVMIVLGGSATTGAMAAVAVGWIIWRLYRK